MNSFAEQMKGYQDAAGGEVGDAYRGLMGFFRDLRNRLRTDQPDLAPGAIHVGEMDATYIPLVPSALKERQLKALVIFFHASGRFEVWLSGSNKAAQSDWWERFRSHDFSTYPLAEHPTNEFQFVREVIATAPNFDALDELAEQLADKAAMFVSNIEQFLQQIDA